MRSPFERVLIGIFILGTLGLLLWTNLTRPRVMVLHSYNTDYAWTRDVNIGIHRVLDDQTLYSVRWHNMNLKRHPWAEYKEKAGTQARRAIDDYQPDVLIAIDDDAQKYAARFYVDHPRIRIVFAGLNGGIEPYGYDKAANATGILERKQLEALERAILDMGMNAPDGAPPRLVVIGDRSESVKLDVELIASYRWAHLRYGGAHLVDTFDEWKQLIGELDGKADVIAATNYRRLTRSGASRELVPADEVVKWTEAHSRVPLVGTNGFYVEDGGMLAIGTSGYEQGEVAARLAVRIINDHLSPKSLPVVSTTQFVVYVRPTLLQQRRLHLPPLYEAFARATNNYVE